MHTKVPTCAITTGKTTQLKISITDKKDGMAPKSWTTFKMKFNMTVTNPSDLIGVSPNLVVSIMKSGSKVAASADTFSAAALAVTKPTGTGTGKAYISFGLDATALTAA